MTDVFIYSAMYIPRGKGKKDGALYSVKPVNLMVGLLRAAQRRNDSDTAQVDDTVLGYVASVGDQGANITKTAVLMAGQDEQVAGVQINRFCASGLEVVNLGMMKVRSGFEDLVLVGGVEPMSRVPTGSDGGAWAPDSETNLHTSFVPQGIGADLITTLEGFSCADADVLALRSQQKTVKTRAEGLLGRSLVLVAGRSDIVLFDYNEFIRADSIPEGLAALKPSSEMMGQMGFNAIALRKYSQVECIEYVHTPGSSPRIVDDASATLVGSEAKGREPGLKVWAQVVITTVTFINSVIVLTSPVPTTHKALAKAGPKVEDTDPFEVNEALASVVMKFMKGAGVAESEININDGTIVMGHPPDVIGCVILGTLLDELERRNLRYDLATLYVGGGMGIATIIERV